jgi:hypothetical protein
MDGNLVYKGKAAVIFWNAGKIKSGWNYMKIARPLTK